MTNLVLSVWFLFAQSNAVPAFGREPWRCSGTDADFVIERYDAGKPPDMKTLRAVYPEAAAWWPTLFPKSDAQAKAERQAAALTVFTNEVAKATSLAAVKAATIKWATAEKAEKEKEAEAP